jgi:hypothetical protein
LAYDLHPSTRLRALFTARPFQGADPSTARFIFFGLDANFAKDIESTAADFFEDEICPYLMDGVLFWQSRNIHHPFLIPGYGGSGFKYHERFAKIGFGREHASQVSFVEALDVPTCGSGYPPKAWLNRRHLERLESWVYSGSAQYVFMPPSVVDLLRKSGAFSELPALPTSHYRSLPILHRSARTTIYCPFHFCYRFAPPGVRKQQLDDIGSLIERP